MSDGVDQTDTASSRRTVLRFGAAAIPAFATLKASPAAAATSIMQCRIPLTTTETGGKWITYGNSNYNNGTLVAANTANSYPPLSSTTAYYKGQELRDYGAGTTGRPTSGKTLSTGASVSSNAFDAHAAYIQKLTSGKTGFSCYASISASFG